MLRAQKNAALADGQTLFYFTIFKYLLILTLWFFVIIHAFSMDITNDEAYSFFLLKTHYYRAMPGTANTHWLNSVFMKLFMLLFGNQPGYLRLHSILSFPFFALGIFRLSALMNSQLSRILYCCILLLNPYVLDYFSLARGYAMALTFDVWLILFLLDALADPVFHYTKWLRVFLCAVFMTASNLSYFYSVVGVAGIFIVLLMLPFYTGYSLEDKQVRKIIAFFCVLILFTIADLIFIKYYGKDLGYGGEADLVSSVIGSVWQASLYFSDYGSYIQAGITYISFSLIVFSMIWFTIGAFGERRFTKGLLIAFPVLSILMLSLLFHVFFKTSFLYYRTALQWLPAGILLIFLCFEKPGSAMKYKNYALLPIKILLITAVCFHFLTQANRHYCFEYRVQAEAGKSLQDLYGMHAKHPFISYDIEGVYVNYYRIVNKDLATLSPGVVTEENLTQGDPDELKKILQSDYMLISTPATLEWMQKKGIAYKMIKEYPYTPAKLISMGEASQAVY